MLGRAFTLVELLIVIIIIAILAAVVVPAFRESTLRAKEAALKTELRAARDAVQRFFDDTDRWPMNLSDLASASAPAQGYSAGGTVVPLSANRWRGPYLEREPKDPVSGAPLSYTTTNPGLGTVKSSATGNSLDGTPYSSW